MIIFGRAMLVRETQCREIDKVSGGTMLNPGSVRQRLLVVTVLLVALSALIGCAATTDEASTTEVATASEVHEVIGVAGTVDLSDPSRIFVGFDFGRTSISVPDDVKPGDELVFEMKSDSDGSPILRYLRNNTKPERLQREKEIEAAKAAEAKRSEDMLTQAEAEMAATIGETGTVTTEDGVIKCGDDGPAIKPLTQMAADYEEQLASWSGKTRIVYACTLPKSAVALYLDTHATTGDVWGVVYAYRKKAGSRWYRGNVTRLSRSDFPFSVEDLEAELTEFHDGPQAPASLLKVLWYRNRGVFGTP